MFFLPIFVMISLSLFGSVYAQPMPTQEEIDRFNLASNQQTKYTQKLTDIFRMCGDYAAILYIECTSFLETLNHKTGEAFNETKTDIDKILYG